MQPRRFARVRPTGRISSEAKLIVGPKAPLLLAVLLTTRLAGPVLRYVGRSSFPIDSNCSLAAQRNVVGLFGKLANVWGFRFSRFF